MVFPVTGELDVNPEDLQLLITRTMPFGKYKGRVIADLPGHYLAWFAREGFPKGELGRLLALPRAPPSRKASGAARHRAHQARGAEPHGIRIDTACDGSFAKGEPGGTYPRTTVGSRRMIMPLSARKSRSRPRKLPASINCCS